jgi:gluconate 2-dehydrogenase gamma chain
LKPNSLFGDVIRDCAATATARRFRTTVNFLNMPPMLARAHHWVYYDRMRRRHFLEISLSSVGGLLFYTLDRKPGRVLADQKPVRVPLRYFTQIEALQIAAAAARIFPSDDTGPGATEAGVILYIDRQLAGPYGQDRYRYTQPPFETSVPELGYQEKATPRDIYREGLKMLAGFDRFDSAAQDRALTKIEKTVFFSLLRTHVIEGMFCDPMHGGNIDMIGWQLIGFPGPQMSFEEEVDKYYGREFRPTPKSLQQVLGKK